MTTLYNKDRVRIPGVNLLHQVIQEEALGHPLGLVWCSSRIHIYFSSMRVARGC